MTVNINDKPKKIIQQFIEKKGYFPGNSVCPLLIYKGAFEAGKEASKGIKALFHENGWTKAWTNGIFDYHHYHSNTHEVMGITAGECTIQFGGPYGSQHTVEKGDVVIIPAGVSHKNIRSTPSFECVGAYPLKVDYDVNYGTEDELDSALKHIKKLKAPKADPIYGIDGFISEFWK